MDFYFLHNDPEDRVSNTKHIYIIWKCLTETSRKMGLYGTRYKENWGLFQSETNCANDNNDIIFNIWLISTLNHDEEEIFNQLFGNRYP